MQLHVCMHASILPARTTELLNSRSALPRLHLLQCSQIRRQTLRSQEKATTRNIHGALQRRHAGCCSPYPDLDLGLGCLHSQPGYQRLLARPMVRPRFPVGNSIWGMRDFAGSDSGRHTCCCCRHVSGNSAGEIRGKELSPFPCH